MAAFCSVYYNAPGLVSAPGLKYTRLSKAAQSELIEK